MEQPTLTVLVGLPGAGKSTYAKKLGQPIVAVDDFLRADDKGKNPTPADNQYAREQALRAVVSQLKTSESVIYDHTNLTPELRSGIFRTLTIADLTIPIVAHFCDTDFRTCVRRNQDREFDLSPLNILYLALALTPPVKKEGFTKITIEHSKKSPTQSPSLRKLLTNPTPKNLNPTALQTEIIELNIFAQGLTKLNENWTTDLPENFAALLDSCTENHIDPTKQPELITAWLFKDLFRIITEYFATQHPEAELPTQANLNELIFERVLKPQLNTYNLDLTVLKKLLTGYYATAEQNATPPKGLTEKLLTILLVS